MQVIAKSIPIIENLVVHVVPILADNYAYLIEDALDHCVYAVDPAEPIKIERAMKELKGPIKLSHILTTHHHVDHAGGNKVLQEIYGSSIVGNHEGVGFGCDPNHLILVSDQVFISKENYQIASCHVPCHTMDSLVFMIKVDKKVLAAFTGDTLFLAGCGRFFEGQPKDMFGAFSKLRSILDAESLLFVGHEYTLNNLRFALTEVESDKERDDLMVQISPFNI